MGTRYIVNVSESIQLMHHFLDGMRLLVNLLKDSDEP